MVIDAGRDASEVSLLESNTTSGIGVTTLRVTVRLAKPPFSRMGEGLMASSRLSRSLACIASAAEELP